MRNPQFQKMLPKLSLFFAILCGVYGGSYDFAQIRALIDRSLTCLEKHPNLSENATLQVAIALAYCDMTYVTVPNLSPGDASILQGYTDRMKAFIFRGLEAYPNNPLRSVWYSTYWGALGNDTFVTGRVPKMPRLPKTLSQIVDRTIMTEEVLTCTYELFVENPPSNSLRPCTAQCQDIMANTDFETGVSPEARAYYYGFEQILNCSNFSPQEYLDHVSYNCGYMKREVETMLRYKGKPEFVDTFYYFLNKVVYCSGWGLEEFLSEYIATTVIGAIDCDGCTGADGTLEDQQVMTAQTLAYLSSVLRLITEEAARS